MDKNLRNLFYLVWLCTLASWPSSLKAECRVTATGLCTPGVEETIVIDEIETIEYEADGYTVTTETTTTTTRKPTQAGSPFAPSRSADPSEGMSTSMTTTQAETTTSHSSRSQ